MKEYKILNKKGAVLDKNQLRNYLSKIALSHNLKQETNKNTYPIPRLKENFILITDLYHLLSEHIKLRIPIHPAGEWILDNYYIIEEAVKNIQKELTLKKYTNFCGIADGPDSGFARAYVLAAEIVAYTDGKIDHNILKELLKAYQEKKTLNMDEIWSIGMFLQIALIENIREICEKIYSSQMQKYRVENIIERLVENKEKEEIKFKNISEYKAKVKGYGEMKYPFIEYMSYRLKKYGKRAYPFLNILEEQVNKIGLEVSDVIQKEHFDIAVRKVSIGNSILSIRSLQRMNLADIFEEINGVNEILKNDPAQIYEKMDYKTKIEYRNAIKEISQKTKISEIYIAKKCLELAQKVQEENIQNEKTEKNLELQKREHIGYYLISEGKQELLKKLLNKEIKITNQKQKVKTYLFCILIITTILAFGVGGYLYKHTSNILLALILSILIWIPIQTILVQLIQYILGKIVKPKIIPKLNFQNGIPEKYATFVVIPTILKERKKVKELMEKLEVYYWANKSDNLYFCLLGDCSQSKNEKEDYDKEIIEEGNLQIEKLNNKYPNLEFPKFHFIYRKRTWNEKEECYLGWERKRGLLNQLNEYLLGNSKNEFLENSIENWKTQKENSLENNAEVKRKIPQIKYIITLDADTNLVLNTGLELVGAMAHILNEPILNNEKSLVISGHALIQPRVGINLKASRKSNFTKLYAGLGGIDSYTNAISDLYQDNFEEGIFTGKGIYNLPVFSTVLNNEIPENTVLSHDLLEGNYLRCGLASDIMLMDGYPVSYNSFKTRQHRWIRGDWQITSWLKRTIINKNGEKKKNPLNLLSKYKILDNLLRSLLEPNTIILLAYLIILKLNYKINIWPIIIIAFSAITSSSLLEIINRILLKKEAESKQKTFKPVISGVKASIARGILLIGALPDRAYMCANAIAKTIYRKNISKKHLLEWTTSEEAEKLSKKTLVSYYKNMIPNIICGVIALILAFIAQEKLLKIILIIISILWLVVPFILFEISKEEKETKKIGEVNKKNQEYVLEIGKRTWNYFKENLVEEFNFLPPDNYQEDRSPQLVPRTSSTNIGLALLAVVSSYDLGYEDLEDTINLIEKIINKVAELPKWNGHLYNWYDIKNMTPLIPKYVSTVDSGNFIGYLYVLKQFLEEVKINSQNKQKNVENNKENKDIIVNNEQVKLEKIDLIINTISSLIDNTDFSHLYKKENQIFSIGFNVEENELTDSYYDLLASEARQASLVAIAKKDVPPKHWYNLSRTLTILNKYKGLISWSGTAFEYLMPNMNIPKEPGSLLDESTKFLIMCGQEYSKKLKIPWGISEAAFNLKDFNNNYQYKAFGIPWLGLKRGLSDDMVVAPYGSILAITEVPNEVIENLKILEKQGMYEKYGFYESIDYTPNRLRKGEKYANVKTFMAHHQGLILLAINNLFNNNILQKRFIKNPEIEAVEILLQERMPENVIITKEKKEKVEKIKYLDYENYTQREISKPNYLLPAINVIANDHYTVVMNDKGAGYSKYKNKIINRFKETDDETQGIFFYYKNIKTKRIWSSGHKNYLGNADKYTIYFTPDQNKIVRQDGNIETITKIALAPKEPVEIRRIELTNNGNIEETIEITSFLEPVLATKEQDYAHKAFSNLFLNYEWLEENGIMIVKRKKRAENEKPLYLGVTFFTEDETIGELEYEIDKEKFMGRGNLGLPIAIQNSIPFSKKICLTTEPIIAMKRTMKIKPEQKVTLDLIISVGEDRQKVIQTIQEYQNSEKIKRSMELSRAKVEAQTRYLGRKGKELELFQKVAGYLIFQNPLKSVIEPQKVNELIPIAELWKYGISGDLPILLVKIKEVADIDVVKEALNAYEYLRVKNINIDLLILNEEKHNYENYLREEIQNAILNKNIGYLQNQKGGIFVLENIAKEEKRKLQYRANLVIDASLGTISRQLKDLEEEYLEQNKEIANEVNLNNFSSENIVKEPLKAEELKYYNEYGGFSQDGKEYQIRINKEERLPTVWSHVLANPNFGSIITENMGGYTWYKNSRLNRLTAWSNNPVTDVPSEVIYLEDMETKKAWSMGLNPMPDDNDYYITYGFGYAKYKHTSNGISQNLEIVVPKDENAKIQLLHLENLEPRKRKVKIIYYAKPVIEEDEIKAKGYLRFRV